MVAAASPLEGHLVTSIQWSGTVKGTFHEHDVSSPPVFVFTARGTLFPGGKSTVSGSISEIHGGWSGTMAITTRHGKIMANLASPPELDVPVESLHYIERAGTGQYAHTTGEGDAEFANGGQIKVIARSPNGVSSTVSVLLDSSDTVFTIEAKAKGITPA